MESLREEYFLPSEHRSACPWKGVASYRSLCVDGQVNHDAAWEYPHPSVLARKIKGRVAFWRGASVLQAVASDEPTVS